MTLLSFAFITFILTMKLDLWVIFFVWTQGKVAELSALSRVCVCVCVSLCARLECVRSVLLIRMLQCVCSVCVLEIKIPVVNMIVGPVLRWPALHLKERKKRRGRGKEREVAMWLTLAHWEATGAQPTSSHTGWPHKSLSFSLFLPSSLHP